MDKGGTQDWEKYALKTGSNSCRRDTLRFGISNKKHISFGTLDDRITNNSIICTAPTKTFNLAGLQISSVIIKNEKLREKYL